MHILKFGHAATLALALFATAPANAQSIGYSDALGRLGAACGKDIEKYCKKVNLGGGRMTQCLNQNQASVSPACKSSVSFMQALITNRARARAAVMKVCDTDIRRFCPGIQAGDGNLMECYFKSKQNMSAQCQKTVADAGFEAKLAPSTATSQVALSDADLVTSLQGADQTPTITAARLRQMAAQSIADPSRANRANRAHLATELDHLAQLTIAIQFDLDSARIRPDSFQAVGLMADALYHPYLQGYRFLVVGHTDATGSREHNLKLSQQRADAIREALINPFGIRPSRVEAVGLGEEQLLKPDQPEAAENRRVQLINIGPGN